MKSTMLSLALVLGSTIAALGQPVGDAVAPDRFGVTDEAVHVIHAGDLDPIASTVAYATFLFGRYSSNDGSFFSSVMLPSGSILRRVSIDACDNSVVGEVQVGVYRCVSPSNNVCTVISQVFTGVPFTDGGSCATFQEVLAVPEIIDNENNLYVVTARNPGNATLTTRINGVRFHYRLQVSPAPDTATFADVPTSHPLFQFVEALAASGITAGCDADNFCPNDPLTRGQMAVFLAKALGLHWVP